MDYQKLVLEAHAGLEKGQRDLAEEESGLQRQLEEGQIIRWRQLDGPLRKSYEAVLGDIAGEEARRAFNELVERTKYHLTPQEAGIFLGWHMHVASYMQPKQVVGYFAGLLRNQENRLPYRP
ncbi:MAG: hypothetical protein HYT72_04625 [Candidatus Aenigmarchaeota archaeon]|nr:hypothetical protein [Candidatus Aenigmarchaeota archaeon]